ncbi:unnamed protein product [Prunus armeniaca]
MKAAGSLGVVVCLFLVVVGVLVEVVPMAEGDTTPSQCKQEKDLPVSACKRAGEEPGFLPSPRVIFLGVDYHLFGARLLLDLSFLEIELLDLVGSTIIGAFGSSGDLEMM